MPATHTATATSASSSTDSSIGSIVIVSTVAVTRDRTTVTTQTDLADDAGDPALRSSSTLPRGAGRRLSYDPLAGDSPER